MMWKETTAFVISYSRCINNCIVTHYRLDIPGIDTGERKIFQTHPDQQWGIRSFPGEKWPGCGIFIVLSYTTTSPLYLHGTEGRTLPLPFPQVVKEWTQLKHY